MSHKTFLAAGAALLLLGAPAFAQGNNDSTSGPAAGKPAQPNASVNKGGSSNGMSNAASVGAPGQAGKPGAESDPGTMPAPGQKK